MFWDPRWETTLDRTWVQVQKASQLPKKELIAWMEETDSISVEAQEKLVRSSSSDVVAAVAQRTELAPELQLRLLEEKAWLSAKSLSLNPALCGEAREWFLQKAIKNSFSGWVYQKAEQNFARFAALTSEEQRSIAKTGGRDSIMGLLERADVSVEVRDIILSRDGEKGRRSRSFNDLVYKFWPYTEAEFENIFNSAVSENFAKRSIFVNKHMSKPQRRRLMKGHYLSGKERNIPTEALIMLGPDDPLRIELFQAGHESAIFALRGEELGPTERGILLKQALNNTVSYFAGRDDLTAAEVEALFYTGSRPYVVKNKLLASKEQKVIIEEGPDNLLGSLAENKGITAEVVKGLLEHALKSDVYRNRIKRALANNDAVVLDEDFSFDLFNLRFAGETPPPEEVDAETWRSLGKGFVGTYRELKEMCIILGPTQK